VPTHELNVSLDSGSTQTAAQDNDRFDLIVLGAGSGGLAAAKRAARHGARVAIVEGDRVGGTCVIRGCVPKKLLVYGSQVQEQLAAAPCYGVTVSDARQDVSVLLENVRQEVDRLNALHISFLEKAGVTLVSGWGRFVDSHRIAVRAAEGDVDERVLYGDRILIAVGGQPKRPSIPGADLAWVSDHMFLQTHYPQQVVVVGAGFIACEFACILAGLGVKVTQLVRGDHLLRGFDRELADAVQEGMAEKGISFCFGTSPVAIEGVPGDLLVRTSENTQFPCGGVLLATGRQPLLEGLDLAAAGVQVEAGRVPVDAHQATNVAHIHAVGDVTDRVCLTPVAIDEGRAYADAAFAGVERCVDHELVASAVFSQPELATVGLSEEEAVNRYGRDQVVIHRARFRSMAQALPKTGPRCLLKLVVEAASGRVLGCHMVGEHAAEIIQMAAIAIGMGATKADFDRTMALHPSVAEEFVTMG